MDPAAVWLMFAGGLLSFTTLFFLFQRHIAGAPLLRYQRRVRVPWGAGGTVLALYFVIERLLAAWLIPLLGIGGESVAEGNPADGLEPSDFVTEGWMTISMFLLITIFGIGWLVVVCKATRHDLGLPGSLREYARDIRIGIVAGLASLAPVYMVQVALSLMLQPDSRHPLLDQLEQSTTPEVLVTVLGAAVLAAPLFEEFTFRLLLQGALERLEDVALGFRATERRVERPVEPAPASTGTDPHEIIGDNSEDRRADPEDAIRPDAIHLPAGRTDSVTLSDPPPNPLPIGDHPGGAPSEGLLPGLPHGWFPILGSGFLFGLAHFGHGVDPVPLFLFGTILGYLYQRTHRIVPSITAHMLLNGYSLILAWLQFGDAPY